MQYIVRFLARLVFFVLYRVEIVNLHNLPKKGAAILCANHNSEVDMFFIGYKTKRLIRWMAKEELFKFRPLGFVLSRLGAFPVKRGKADVGAIRKALQLLEEGHIVGVFPQGTRTRGQGRNLKAKSGVAMLAANSNAPLIPVALEGSAKPFSKIRVVYGEPYYLNIEKDRKHSNEELNEMSQLILDKIYMLLEAGK